jgi:hypothetical protein
MVADELAHPVKERLRHLSLQAHPGAACARWTRSGQCPSRRLRVPPVFTPVRWRFRRSLCCSDPRTDLSFPLGIAHGAPRQCSPVRHNPRGFVKASSAGGTVRSWRSRLLAVTGWSWAEREGIVPSGRLEAGCQGPPRKTLNFPQTLDLSPGLVPQGVEKPGKRCGKTTLHGEKIH